MPQKHYSPPLSRFNICALYHQAKHRGIPMTQLTNELVEAGLKGSPGWKQAEQQMSPMRLTEEAVEYQTK